MEMPERIGSFLEIMAKIHVLREEVDLTKKAITIAIYYTIAITKNEQITSGKPIYCFFLVFFFPHGH